MTQFFARIAPLLILLSAVACAPTQETTTPGGAAGSETAPSQDEGFETTDSEATDSEAPDIHIATLSYPVDWLVRRLGDGAIATQLMIPRGESPTFWRPQAEVIIELQEADLIVMNGAGYEAWTGQANLPLSRLLETSSDLDLIKTRGRTHSHGDGGEHSHASLDPHTWMDPDLYLEQGRRIHTALKEITPEASWGRLEKALASLEDELAALSNETEEAVEPLRGMKMAANHLSFAYFQRRFGLEIEVIDLDPQRPNADQIAAFTAWAEAQTGEGESAILLWTEQPSEETLAALPAWAISLYLDPLEQPAADEYDYAAQTRANIERLRQIEPR